MNRPLVESKTRTYYGRVGSGRPAEQPGGVGQGWVPTADLGYYTKYLPGTQNITSIELHNDYHSFRINLSTPKPDHTTGESDRGARRSGGAAKTREGTTLPV